MKILTFVITFLAFIFFTLDSWCQSATGIVRDSVTRQPIPFVNIWLEGESIGTTANEKGEYSFNNTITGKRLVFSHISYKKKIVIAADSGYSIMLQPEVFQLKEIVVNARKGKSKTNTVGEEYRFSNVRRFFFCGESPY